MKTRYICNIRNLLILCIALSTSTAFAQHSTDLIIDRQFNMFEFEPNLIYLDTLGDNYVTILCEAKATGTIPPNYLNRLKIKLLNSEGKTIRERDFGRYSDITPNCIKIKNNYLMIGNTYYIDGLDGCFIDYQLVDTNFEILEQNVLNLSQDDYPVRHPKSSVYGQFIQTIDTLYFILPVQRRFDFADENIFAVLKFNNSGYYHSYASIPQNQEFDRNSLKTPVPFLVNNNYLIANKEYFNLFNPLTNSLQVIKPKLIREPVFDAYSILYTANALFVYGHGIEPGTNNINSYCLKLDSNFNLIDSIKLDYKMEKGYAPGAYDHGVPPGCFYLDEAGNLNAISYYNSTLLGSSQATPGRIFVSKFTPDLKVICQESYEMPRWKANLYYGLYLGQGELLVTGSIDTIGAKTNRIKEYYPFIGLIRDGCALTWATRVEELSSKDPLDFPGEILVSPNPASNQLHLEYMGDYPLLSLTRIFNSAGVVTHVVPAWQSNNLTIDLKNYPPGIYFYSVTTKSGKVTTGKFIKS